MIGFDLQVKIAEWRRKALDNTITIEELKEAIVHLRQGRTAAMKSSASKGSRNAVPKPDGDQLLKELGI
jgi:hypothetical protein